jgi:hypothetical protein
MLSSVGKGRRQHLGWPGTALLPALSLFLILSVLPQQLLLLCSAEVYDLPDFSVVRVEQLANDNATILIAPSAAGSFTINATQAGFSFAVTNGVLELSQSGFDAVQSFFDELLGEQVALFCKCHHMHSCKAATATFFPATPFNSASPLLVMNFRNRRSRAR